MSNQKISIFLIAALILSLLLIATLPEESRGAEKDSYPYACTLEYQYAKNPHGSGVVVYTRPETINGYDRFCVWLCIEKKMYALNGYAADTGINDGLLLSIPDDVWKSTGLKYRAAWEVVGVVYGNL